MPGPLRKIGAGKRKRDAFIRAPWLRSGRRTALVMSAATSSVPAVSYAVTPVPAATSVFPTQEAAEKPPSRATVAGGVPAVATAASETPDQIIQKTH